ncbi:hypothetical protein OCUAc20_30510 [Acinetobacter baumannii]|nr:hypothetical protein OCUAc20_30510 [Acinetobacter baumannii]
MCQLINERFPDHDITVIPDASGQATSSKNFSESDHAILKKNGFKVEVNGVNPGIKDRITAVNAQILNAEGERHLKVNTNKCPNFTATLEQQVYDDFGMPDKSAGLDHVGDAGGYPIAKRFPVIIQKIFKRRAIAGFLVNQCTFSGAFLLVFLWQLLINIRSILLHKKAGRLCGTPLLVKSRSNRHKQST